MYRIVFQEAGQDRSAAGQSALGHGRHPVDRADRSAWRDLPKEFGPWQTVYHHFNQWSSQGKLSQILRHLKQAMSDSESFDHELWCIDGTVVRAARCAAGGGKKVIRKSLLTTL